MPTDGALMNTIVILRSQPFVVVVILVFIVAFVQFATRLVDHVFLGGGSVPIDHLFFLSVLPIYAFCIFHVVSFFCYLHLG